MIKRFKLNVKAITLAEHILNLPFSRFDFDEARVNLVVMYSMYVASSEEVIPLSKFEALIQREAFLKQIAEKTKQAMEFMAMFQATTQETAQTGEACPDSWMADLAHYLVVDGGIDPQFVYYDMEVHEIPKLVEQIGRRKKEAMEDKRLWAYFAILPHVNAKVIKEPSDLIAFPWEVDAKLAKYEEQISRDEERFNKFMEKGVTHGEQ